MNALLPSVKFSSFLSFPSVGCASPSCYGDRPVRNVRQTGET